jgi:RNA-directed DNA polymerase
MRMTRRLDQTAQEGKQMTEEPQEDSTGAPFHGGTDWHALNWQSVNHNVRRLQARIVKATQEKRWGKVKALQRLLTHSFSGKALAVRRVTENQGKNTPGVDKVTREHSTKEDQRRLLAQAKGLPSPTAQANLHT